MSRHHEAKEAKSEVYAAEKVKGNVNEVEKAGQKKAGINPAIHLLIGVSAFQFSFTIILGHAVQQWRSD